MPEKGANGKVMYDQQGRKSKINYEDDGELQHNGNVCSIWIMTNERSFVKEWCYPLCVVVEPHYLHCVENLSSLSVCCPKSLHGKVQT